MEGIGSEETTSSLMYVLLKYSGSLASRLISKVSGLAALATLGMHLGGMRT